MKKRTKIILGSLFIILVMLNLTVPSKDDYYEWLEDEYNIKKSDKLYYYTKGDIELFDRSTYQKRFGIFATRQQNFEYKDDEKLLGGGSTVIAFRELNSDEGFTIRTLEIGKMIITIEKESILWKILM
ncbi:hypothetical protein [Senegalia massiliensis]|uniref:hypothetical protein n=1 Tax=Senegalia massiliensis TaxID=1720316 RepID=UPI00102FFBD1|nr:hypothetical protein [Senegalia massiliensis]